MFEGLLKYNTLPNMLTTHPPMQMDGNFGIVGGVCEILRNPTQAALKSCLPLWMRGRPVP